MFFKYKNNTYGLNNIKWNGNKLLRQVDRFLLDIFKKENIEAEKDSTNTVKLY